MPAGEKGFRPHITPMARRPAAKQKMVTMDRAELQATTCWASCSSPPISWTITALVTATGEQKTGAKNRKVWKRVDVSNNPLDSTEFLERLRADWAKQCNLMLPEGVRIDHRSLEAQGIERIPTIHEGHASREITKRGGHSILNAINRRIATANRYLTAIRKQMGDPTGLLGQFKEQARKELDTAMSRFRESLCSIASP